VPELERALRQTAAKRCLTLNLGPQPGETDGFSPETHLEVLSAHAPELRIDAVLVDPSAVVDADQLAEVAASMGAVVLTCDVALADGTARHDPLRLAAAYRDLFSGAVRTPG
jgi:2-phospho-L-lactate transferase/gluconeogenesis factor (CofD/UPF0052 family)